MSLEEIRQAKADFAALLRGKGKAVLAMAISQLFDAAPEVAAIRWTQYTPHFNDGDPCTFNVHGVQVKFVEGFDVERLEKYYREEAKEGEFVDEGTYCFNDDKDPVRQALKTFQDTLSELEEVAHTLGDGVQVTATRGTTELEVDEYDHD